MTIQEFLKKQSRQDLSKSKKFPVRELELDPKGKYIAFVDDAEHSFDVSIVLDGEVIIVSDCDCHVQEDSCLHKIAVVMAIKNKFTEQKRLTKSKQTKGRKAKLTESDELLLQMDKDVLVHWLKEVFKKNKPFEKQFLLTFGKKEISYTPEQVKETTEQVIASVAGKRKTLEAVKIKKILDLLTIALEPVETFVVANINKPIAYKIFSTFLDTLYAFDHRVSHYSKKLGVYVDEYIERFALSINNIQDDKQWRHIVEIQLHRLFELPYLTNKEYDYMLVQYIYLTASHQRMNQYVDLLKEILLAKSSKRYLFRNDFTQFLLKVSAKHNIYQDVRVFFDN
ncbi:hypothetical protein GJV76_03465 [Myroides sp. BIT-d1]|uniref:SWIM-type domain-containing protein n=1 Tax=Myroides albus TaxID=2562892 RepID=A0A6I3LJ41_9FLAO|nr:hypothetical protein [Myroides albus]MTG97200.1 hypothetical protein [Myroides albus]